MLTQSPDAHLPCLESSYSEALRLGEHIAFISGGFEQALALIVRL